jgi:hypothetical protein
MTTSIGNKQEVTYPAFVYTHTESTLALCGPIEYEVGSMNPVPANTDPYIIIDTTLRKMTYYPRSKIY